MCVCVWMQVMVWWFCGRCTVTRVITISSNTCACGLGGSVCDLSPWTWVNSLFPLSVVSLWRQFHSQQSDSSSSSSLSVVVNHLTTLWPISRLQTKQLWIKAGEIYSTLLSSTPTFTCDVSTVYTCNVSVLDAGLFTQENVCQWCSGPRENKWTCVCCSIKDDVQF